MQFIPEQASSIAVEYDIIFWALTALTVIFTGLVVGLVIFFAIRYRRGTKVDRSRPVYEDLRLELTWTIIPLLLGLAMFFFGARLFVNMRTMPQDATEIFVIGKQWMWHVQHPNGVRENNTLHVPVDQNIVLTMISQDVIHAFYLPAMRAQMHVVPGRYTKMWFRPTKEGTYHLFCNVYCGTQHSEMVGKIVVLSQKDYAAWLANGGEFRRTMTMADEGHRLFTRLACNNCHTGDDTVKGPSLGGLYGRTRRMADGGTLVADEAYLREAILRPHNRLTAGYGPTMPAYEGQISEVDVLNLIAFIRTGGVAPATTTVPGQAGPAAVGAMRAEAGVAETPTRPVSPAVGAMGAQGAQIGR
jgi:cytochrome c oxidase subunit II